jgi:4'-phosphopantetheinyl transferase
MRLDGQSFCDTQARAAPPLTHVETYLVTLDVDPGLRASYEAMLTPEEREHASRFDFVTEAERYIVRRGKLRELLADRLDCEPRDVPLYRSGLGKPCVKGSDLRFSLSHSGGVALYVFGRDTEIGCDIEWRRPELAKEGLAERFFSDRELKSLRAVPSSCWVEAFFNCWTRKEAFVKALGFGVTYPLKAFDVSLAPGEPAALLRGPLGWLLRSFEPLEGLQAAIAVKQL